MTSSIKQRLVLKNGLELGSLSTNDYPLTQPDNSVLLFFDSSSMEVKLKDKDGLVKGISSVVQDPGGGIIVDENTQPQIPLIHTITINEGTLTYNFLPTDDMVKVGMTTHQVDLYLPDLTSGEVILGRIFRCVSCCASQGRKTIIHAFSGQTISGDITFELVKNYTSVTFYADPDALEYIVIGLYVGA